MSEHPILMNAEMVRATLAGRKTQTRRAVRGEALRWLEPGMFTAEYVASAGNSLSPFGYAGDELWVRETARAIELDDGLDVVQYSADMHQRPIENIREAIDPWMAMNHYRGRRGAVVPSIHMPRWASRLQLAIEAVSIQRLRDMTIEDALAEGMEPAPADADEHEALSPFVDFMCLWDSLPGPRFDSNPFVWVVTFRKLRP